MLKISAPKGMPVESWAVIGPHGPTVGGFPTAQAAEAWAQEWRACPQSIVAPIISVSTATQCLLRYEQEAQGLGPGEGA